MIACMKDYGWHLLKDMSQHIRLWVFTCLLAAGLVGAGCSTSPITETLQDEATPTPSGLEIKEDEGFSHKVELPTKDPDATPLPVMLPGKDDILLWLDASEGAAASGSTVIWTDKIQGTEYAFPGELIQDGLNGLPVVRMAEEAEITLDAGLELGAYTVFLVYQRGDEQTKGPDDQRVFSVIDGDDPDDEYMPGFAHIVPDGDQVIAPRLYLKEVQLGGRERFAVGQNAASGRNPFHGDLAEVILYQKTFVMPEPIDDIQDYLGEKWGVDYTAQMGWTASAPQTETVQRTSHNYPLSDQDNLENWTIFEPWTDEFDDGVLDTEKWLPHNHEWYGRQPARFLPENISEGGGLVKLAMKKDPTLPVEDLYGTGVVYENYSSATLQSLTGKRYGYVEIRARAGVGSSAFWLYAETYRDQDLHNKLEIDVYEIGGRERGYEELYNMNTWVWVIDGTPIIFETGGKWHSGIPFADEFHVFGFKWTEDELSYYVDGILVRRMPNRHYHSPLILLFDTETMPVWFGVPPDEHLPAYHEIDYVRTWTNAETVDTWEGDYTLMYDPRINNPTGAYVSQFPSHVDEGVPGPLADRVFCELIPARVDESTQYTFDLAYATAAGEKNIAVEIWAEDILLGKELVTVPGETNDHTQVTLALDIAPAEGLNYQVAASIQTHGEDQVAILDFCRADLIIGADIPVTGLQVSPALKSLQPGETWQMQPFVFPANASNPDVIWQSMNEAAAVVDNDGIVTAKSPGLVTIAAVTVDGEFTAQGVIHIVEMQEGLIRNPGFETGELAPWTFFGEVALSEVDVHTGAYGVVVNGVGAAEQAVTLESNTNYELRGYGKVGKDGDRVFFGVKGYEADPEEYADVTFTLTTMEEGVVTFTTGANPGTTLVYFYVETAGQQGYGDDFQLVKVE